MDEALITLIPGLLVTIATFLMGTVVNNYIIVKIIQKPKCFLNYSLELNVSFLGLVVCFFISLLSITENVLSLTKSAKYPEMCGIKLSCSSGLEVSLMVNLMVLSYRRSKKIRTIDSSPSNQTQYGLISVIVCWTIGLLVTIICLVIIFSQPITSDHVSQGCEFHNNDSIFLINCLLLLTFLISVSFISIINIKIMRFIRKPVVVFPISAVNPNGLQNRNSSSNKVVSSSVIQTKQLLNIPDQSSVFTQPGTTICSIRKFSCSSISSSIYVDSRAGSHTENSNMPRSNSIFSSAKEDDNESNDESIFSISDGSNSSSHSIGSNQIQLHNGILSQLNNTVKVANTKIKLCDDISKLRNCNFKQNFISTIHSPVILSAEELFNKNNQNVRFVSERLVSQSSQNTLSVSEYSAYNSKEDERYIYQTNTHYEKSSFHSNSDDTDVNKSDSDSETSGESDSESDNVSLGDIVDHNLSCSEQDGESDQHEDCSDWEMPEHKKQYILTRPRLQPLPMKKRLKRKSNNKKNYTTPSQQLLVSNPESTSHSISPAMNLSRRKAIVNFNYTQLPPGNHSPISPENRKIIFPPRSNWNQNMNMPVMLTRRHRMKRIVFHNLLLELLVFFSFLILPYSKNIIFYDYTQLNMIVKSFLNLSETLSLLLFAINPFLYIIKNKNIMNDLL